MRLTRLLLTAALALALLPPVTAVAGGHGHGHESETGPLVIGHRGASGYRPEHTLEAYRLAAEQGADFIEPDLVVTKDGVLVARHENEIAATTDVADHPEFAARRTTKTIDGVAVTGFFTEDFTLAELKTLRARERIPALRPQNAAYDGRFEVPTLQEVLDLRAELSEDLGRPIGVYPETKHPTYFRAIGLPLEERLVRALEANGLNRRRAPVFVQSFETGNLRALDEALKVPLVQLLGARTAKPVGDPRTYAELATPAGLASIAEYADGVGPAKDYIVPRNPDQSSAAPTSFVADAHAAGLLVHPYTFRRENSFLPLELRSSPDPAGIGDLDAELRQFIALGVDGFFTDNPDLGVAATRATVAVIGDTPYGDAQLAAFPADVEAINADPGVGLVLHLGDIKSGGTQCTDEYFARIRSAFDAFEDPLVYTPGDNEWTDCHRASNGGHVPTERLAAVRDVFFDVPGRTLGEAVRRVLAQPGYPENVRFSQSGVQFGTVHIVGSNDGLAPWFGDRSDESGRPRPETAGERALREREVARRRTANLQWIDRIFHSAWRSKAPAVAIAIQADMWDPSASDLSGFDRYVRRLARRAREFGKPVLLLNGDSHVFTADNPLAAGDAVHGVSRPVPNFSRITVNGSTSCPHEYGRLTLDPDSSDVFRFERVTLPTSAALCPA
jgi:glycerophosphoryl diester phosphodiesterase